MSQSHFTFLAVCAAVSMTVACSNPQAAPPARSTAEPGGAERLKPTYDGSGKLQKLEYDSNNDGKTDTWGYMDGTRVVKVEVDENGDGAVDRWEYHQPAAGAGAVAGAMPAPMDKTVERIERATRHDGKVSRWEHFNNGTLTTIEEDTDGNGKVDKWETYADGSLSVMALDTTGRGTPDRRLVYKPDGSFDRIEADPAGTGTFTQLTQ